MILERIFSTKHAAFDAFRKRRESIEGDPKAAFSVDHHVAAEKLRLQQAEETANAKPSLETFQAWVRTRIEVSAAQECLAQFNTTALGLRNSETEEAHNDLANALDTTVQFLGEEIAAISDQASKLLASAGIQTTDDHPAIVNLRKLQAEYQHAADAVRDYDEQHSAGTKPWAKYAHMVWL